MFVFNITTKVSWDIADEWLDWQREEQIPAIMHTQLFDDHKLFRLLGQEDHEGPTFTLQLFTTDQDRYDAYIAGFAPRLNAASTDKWGDQLVAFSTCMKEIM